MAEEAMIVRPATQDDLGQIVRLVNAAYAKYLDRMSVQAMAAAWNETPKAIESLLSRAREAFRTAYADDDEPHLSPKR